ENRLQVQTIRLNFVGDRSEFAIRWSSRRRLVESILLEIENGRHHLLDRQRHHPLRRALKVSRVKRQDRSAARLPYAVSVAETDEGALVPILDRACEGVAEFLAILRFETRIDSHRVRVRRLQRESELIEAHRRGDVLPVGNFALFADQL